MTESPHPLGRIFTSEPQATRALAAEFRFAPDLIARLVCEMLHVDLGSLTNVRCEERRDARADVYLTFEAGTVAVEAKLDHHLTTDQIDREAEHADHVVLLVLERQDAAGFADHPRVGAVITWEELLNQLPGTRLTLSDVVAVEDRKRHARRILQAIDFPALMPNTDWEPPTPDQTTTSGFPSRYFGPWLDDNRGITVQVALRRGEGSSMFVVNVGVNVSTEDLTGADDTIEPEWITAVRAFCSALEPLATAAGLSVCQNAARGNSDFSRLKMQQAKQWHLPLRYAVGYVPSYLGLKLDPVPADQLPAVLEALIPAVEQARQTVIAAQDDAR